MKIKLTIAVVVLVASVHGQSHSLQQLIDTALLRNFSVLVARENVALSENANTAGQAGMLPSVWLEGGANFTENNTRLEFFNGEIREAKGAGSGGLNSAVRLSWTIFDGMGMFIRRQELNAFQELSELELKAVIAENIALLTEEYYATVRDLKLLEIYKRSLSISQKRLQLAHHRYKAGAVPETEYLNAQVDYNTDSSVYRQLLLTGQIHLANLNLLMGRKAGVELVIDTANFPLSLSIEAPSKETFLQTNPDYIVAEKRVQLALMTVKSASAGNYPTLDLNLGFTFNTSFSEVGILQTNQSLGPSVGVTARWNIFDAGRISREVKAAKIQYETANISREQVMATAEKEWYILEESNRFYNDLIAFEKSNVILAEKSLRIALKSYELGGISEIQLRETQNRLNEAEGRLVQVQFEKLRTEINLKRLLGEW